MSGAAARLTLEDFANATGLPLAALEHPLSQPPLESVPKPCALCDERAQQHAQSLEEAKRLRASIVQSLQQQLSAELIRIQNDIQTQHSKALDSILTALLPAMSQHVLRDRLREEIAQVLRRPEAVTLYVPEDLELGSVTETDQCTLTVDPGLGLDHVRIEQAQQVIDIDPGAIVTRCLDILNTASPRSV